MGEQSDPEDGANQHQEGTVPFFVLVPFLLLL
jgi:hypothetical protein